METFIQNLLNHFLKLTHNQRFILGIDGLSRSGKTTFTKTIQLRLEEKRIPTTIFHIDDFIVDREKRYNTGHDEWTEYYDLQWDVEWLKNHFFIKLKKSHELNLPIYDPITDKQKWKRISLLPTSLIIIEGIFLQRKEWRESFDYMIYLDSSRETRFERENKATQQKINKFKNRYWKAEEYYLKTVNPLAQADLVIKNESN